MIHEIDATTGEITRTWDTRELYAAPQRTLIVKTITL